MHLRVSFATVPSPTDSHTTAAPTDDLRGAPARRATEYAYDHLRQLILSGELAAGSQLSQVKVARQIGVSRTPLREAIRRLQQDGLLLAEVNQRVRVTEAPLDELDDLYALRIVVEATAVHMTVINMSDRDLDALRASLDRLEAAEGAPGPDFDAHHQDFHMRLVAGAAGRLRSSIKESWDHAERYRRLYAVSLGDAAVEQAHREHRAIFDAVAAREPAEAAERLARHYARVALVLVAHHHPELDTSGITAALRLVIHKSGPQL